ncbi:MAG: polysaccharide biosynthesis tyrosine autokinase [Acidobacteria bacterium]|nr:polysaccharide biosynthesis tyrosine autokinase [Acidobacteriota bacterium]
MNLLNAEYIESNVEARWRMSEQTSKWLGHQIDDIRGKLERSELMLQQYARRSGLLFTSGQFGNPDRTNVSDEKLHQMQEQLSRAQEARALTQSHYEIAKAAAPDTLADVLNDQSLRDLQRQITDLRRQAAELKSIYTPKHEKVQRVEVQIAPLEEAFQRQRAAILDRIQNDYETALRHERLLQADYHGQVGVILDQADKSIQYNILKRDVDTNRQLYESMLQQIKASTVASAIRASNIRIVDPGKVPADPYSPNLKINIGLGFIAGFVVGVIFVLVRKSTDRTLQHPGEMQFWTKLSELGVIPSKSVEDIQRLPARSGSLAFRLTFTSLWGRRVGSDPLELAVRQQRPSMLAEAFRTVLTSVLFAGRDGDRPQILAFTSANPAEGKTTITTNLALALAEIRQKVLVVDADLRKPRVHQIFDLSNERGLSTLLNQETLKEGALDGIIQTTSIPGLHVLPSGPPTDTAANLLHSPHLQKLLAKFRVQFDMILIDTPPAIQLTDSRIVGRLADAVILVARAGRTTRDSAMAVASRFSEDRTPLLGSILNDWTPVDSGQLKHIYYGYGQYGSGQSRRSYVK